MSDDPFVDDESNPFADPSVQNAAAEVPEVYNPFESDAAYDTYRPPEDPAVREDFTENEPLNADANKDKKKKKKKKKQKHDEEEDLWNDQPSSEAMPVTGNQSMDISVREAQLARREQELLERERHLEEQLALARKQGLKPFNWPSKCYPITHHSISEDIPAEYQPLMRRLYAIVLATWLGLFWNWVCLLAQWSKGAGGSTVTAMLATLYFALGTPGSWQGWYRRAYYAARDDSGVGWIFFMFNFFLHICFCIVITIGIGQIGMSGFIMMVDMFMDDYPMIACFVMLNTFWFLGIILFSIIYLKKAHTLWKERGGEKQAKKEAARHLAEEAI